MLTVRLLTIDDADQAADLHRRAGALIPGYDTLLHSPEEFRTFYRERVMVDGPVWGAFQEQVFCGHVGLLPGWIDHLYVDPDQHRQGIGSRLVRLAQAEQAELRLHTFQSNTAARALYELHDFIAEEFTDGSRDEEKMPDMTHWWSRAADPQRGRYQLV